MTFYINDYGLSPKELQVKYQEAEHPAYSRRTWVYGDTPLTYWVWVLAQLRQEQEELDADNPYNSWMNDSY